MSQLSLETHKEHDGSEDSCGAWLLMDQLALSLGIQMKQRPSRRKHPVQAMPTFLL